MSIHIAIVGAYGSAGVAAAQRLAPESDIKLTLIDDGEPGGGLCILRGCMPSKEVLSAAEHRFAARHDDRVNEPAPTVDLETVVETKNEHTSNFAAHRRAAVEQLTEHEDVNFIHDTAQFIDERMLSVGEQVIEPDYVIIATGSTVNEPSLPGIDEVSMLTSADVLDMSEFEDSGIVMGFGYVGMELVPYLAEAGEMNLTVIEHDSRPIDEADPPFGSALMEHYRDAFDVTILTQTDEKEIEATADGGVRMTVEKSGNTRVIEADQLFGFTGRRPAVDTLNIDSAGLVPQQGWVESTMQSRENEHVFVVGDANGHEPVLHVAKEHGAIAASNIRSHVAGEPLEAYENTHHHVAFTGLGVLPFARVGHSVESAQKAGIEHISVTRQAASDGVFKSKNVPAGLGRLVVGTDGTILGWQGLHYHADVMAKTMQIAVEMGLDVESVPDRAYHPTTPEILDGLFRAATEELHR